MTDLPQQNTASAGVSSGSCRTMNRSNQVRRDGLGQPRCGDNRSARDAGTSTSPGERRQRSIIGVSADGVCTGCGVCAGVCPTHAITMELSSARGVYTPILSPHLCANCGLCRRVCPPLTWDNGDAAERWHPSLGKYEGIYAAYSAEPEIRRQCSSGGLVTTLLRQLLVDGLITGAVVTQHAPESPLLNQAVLARTPEAIIQAKGSKYSPVTFDRIVRTLCAMDPSRERVAVVGLPCHIEGIFQAMQISKRQIQQVVKYQIGLVCGQSPSLRAYDYILRRLRIDPRNVQHLANRGDGWPGSMTITRKNGSSVKVPYQSALSMGMVLSSPIFTPTACQLCADPVGFRADATVSDAWLERFAGDSLGVNLVLVRNAELGEVLRSMAGQGKLILDGSSAEEFLSANRKVMDHKALNRPVGLRWLLGGRASRYHRYMQADPRRLSWWRRVKLFLFFQHIRLIRRWNLQAAARRLNTPTLFYFKAINLLKR